MFYSIIKECSKIVFFFTITLSQCNRSRIKSISFSNLDKFCIKVESPMRKMMLIKPLREPKTYSEKNTPEYEFFNKKC